jgi:autotransporter adhesin
MFSLSNPSTSNGATQLGSATMTVGTGNSAASLLNSPVVNGLGGLTFSSPGAGNTGYINVSSNFSSLPWLLYNWNQAGLGNTSPTAVATFGVYQGSNKVIYFKEMY